jgi:hypothetical protein
VCWPRTKRTSSSSHWKLTCLLARIPLMWGVLDTTLCDKVGQILAAGRWSSPVTPVSSTNKTDRYDINEILLKVKLNTITSNVYWCTNDLFKYTARILIYQMYYAYLSFLYSNRLLLPFIQVANCVFKMVRNIVLYLFVLSILFKLSFHSIRYAS